MKNPSVKILLAFVVLVFSTFTQANTLTSELTANSVVVDYGFDPSATVTVEIYDSSDNLVASWEDGPSGFYVNYMASGVYIDLNQQYSTSSIIDLSIGATDDYLAVASSSGNIIWLDLYNL